jgi:hypothetical protein
MDYRRSSRSHRSPPFLGPQLIGLGDAWQAEEAAEAAAQAEAERDPPEPLPDFVYAAVEPFDEARDRMADLLDDDEAAELAAELVERELGALVRAARFGFVPGTVPVDAIRRWPGRLVQLLSLTPADLRGPVVRRLDERAGDSRCALSFLLLMLTRHQCRMPLDLAPALARRLVETALRPALRTDQRVCTGCGLYYPWDPEADCPHCGAGQDRIIWAVLVEPDRYSWQSLADAEVGFEDLTLTEVLMLPGGSKVVKM